MLYFGENPIYGLMVGGGYDISTATAQASDILYPKIAFTAQGKTQGTCTYDADTKDATMEASHLLIGESGYKDGVKVIGEMPNNGDVNTAIENGVLKQGYTDGGVIENLKPENILNGVTIGGVTGTGSSITRVTGVTTTGSSTSSSSKVYVDVGFKPDVIMLWMNPGVVTSFCHNYAGTIDPTGEPMGGWSGEIVSGSIVRGQQLVQTTNTGFSLRPIDGTYGLNLETKYEVWKIS